MEQIRLDFQAAIQCVFIERTFPYVAAHDTNGFRNTLAIMVDRASSAVYPPIQVQ